MDRVDFGIGCLTFIPVLDEVKPGDLSSRARGEFWKEQIEEGLALLPSVTNLVVEIDSLYYRMPSRVDPLISQGVDIYDESPVPDSYVGFTITIPKRMHSQLIPWRDTAAFECEQFQFITIYCQGGPVTFIRCLEDSGITSSGSLSIVLVREFLIRELKRLDASIELKTLGPSPFWANFELRVASDDDEATKSGDLHWERVESGYDHVYLYFEPLLESVDDWYSKTVVRLKDGFALYYQAVRGRNKRKARSELVMNMADDLIAAHDRSGLKGWFIKTFRTGRLARDLSITALRAKQVEAYELSDREDSARSTQLPDVLSKLIAAEAAESFRDELEMSIETAKLLEGGRLKQYEVVVLAASTALGAIAGALAALIAS